MKTEILGVHLDNLSMQEVVEKIKHMLATHDKHFVVTPNPEFLVLAAKDKPFKDILNYADIAVADGIGLIYAAKLFKKQLQRVTGVDLMWYVCQLAEQERKSVYFLGARDTVAQQAATVTRQEFPQLSIAGAQSGGIVDHTGMCDDDLQMIEHINQVKPDILFVAFGHGKQEKWIFKHLDKLRGVKVAIGVGGSFDFIAETIPRAPELMQRLGLEWLYRLIQEPKRWRRIYDAVIVFPYLVIKEKLLKKRHRNDVAP